MGKAKKATIVPLAKQLEKQAKIRQELLVKREAFAKIDGARMRAREDADRRNHEMELRRIQGELGMLRPGVGMEVVRRLKEREAQLERLIKKAP